MRISKHIERILARLGEDPTREGLKKTPLRVEKAFKEIFKGYSIDPKEIVTVFVNESKIDQIVGMSGIEFYSMCEHHMLPFYGKAHIYYVPDKKIIGISKLGRILDIYSKRLQNQERIAKQVADALDKYLEPKGVAVILEATHFCMKMRGVAKANGVMKTSELRGCFRRETPTRQELFNLIKQ